MRRTAQPRPELAAAADEVLRAAVESPGGVPGVVAQATSRDATIYRGAAGRRDVTGEQPMTADTVVSLYSCTKAVTAAALMQLVETGRLGLDDRAKDYVPELAQVRVLAGFDMHGEPLLRAPAKHMTVRQLLLHTAGFGYEFFNADLLRYGKTAYAAGLPAGSLPPVRSVLLRDPGTRWEYGSSIDWAGQVVEAVRGAALGAIMREHIFEPLGMGDTGFTLSGDMHARRAIVHLRTPADALVPKPSIGLPEPGQAESGGSGLFSTANDYLRFIRMFLSDGAAPDGRRILFPETVAQMFASGLGELRVQPLPGTIAQLAHDAEFFPGLSKSWGYSWMLNDVPAPTGRPAGAAGWAGLANLFYWIDRRNGVGGFWATQVLPFIDPVSLPAYYAFERTVYDSLR